MRQQFSLYCLAGNKGQVFLKDDKQARGILIFFLWEGAQARARC